MMVSDPDEGAAQDAVLVDMARDGDRAAFGALVTRHYDFVFRVAWRWCGHRMDAEDIAQEVCARLGRAIRSFKGDGAFTTWLYALTLNAARDYSRKAVRESARADAYGLQAVAEENAGDEPEDRAEALWKAVRQLPDKQRQAVLLVYGEGLSHAAAADVLACAEATVSWHIHEAKKRLRVLVRRAEEV